VAIEIASPNAEARDDAEAAGLRYVSDGRPGFSRVKQGDAFVYRRSDGAPLTDPRHLARIKALAIPPAWTDVWICPQANGHLQATGRDAKRRKQYRYHPDFRAMRDIAKFEHMMLFAQVLPTIRSTVEAHLGRRGMPREKVLATIVRLLETTLIRIGNDDYVTQNRSFGLTTLRNRHARVEGADIRFQFRGKSGKEWSLSLRNRRIANIIRRCQELPGQDLLQYTDEAGEPRGIDSSDVNDYLREISGIDISTKDFRTWAGTVLAAAALGECATFDSAIEAKRNIKAAIQKVAARLGNTPAVCRKCYIHPEILSSYASGKLLGGLTEARKSKLCAELDQLQGDEATVMAFLAGCDAGGADAPSRVKTPFDMGDKNPLARDDEGRRAQGSL
jgi:DNA topoisomerase-1